MRCYPHESVLIPPADCPDCKRLAGEPEFDRDLGPGESPEWLEAAERQAITEALDPPPFCDVCWDFTHVAEVSEETVGYEEQQREVTVTRLACGHEIVTPEREDRT